jgi:hypothetical protein
MVAQIYELDDSREDTEVGDAVGDRSPSATLRYAVIGSTDDDEVRTLIESTLPAFWGALTFRSYTMRPQGGDAWAVEAQYGLRSGLSSFTFDTTGGTKKITQSIFTLGSVGKAGGLPAPDHQGAINVTDTAVEGVEIVWPGFKWTETRKVPLAVVTADYRDTLCQMTGTINDDPFRGFDAGEVLFKGAKGSQRDEGDYELTYEFEAKKNQENVSIPGLDLIASVGGWDYLWIEYEEIPGGPAMKLVKRPRAAHVETVYYSTDFDLLLIGT